METSPILAVSSISTSQRYKSHLHLTRSISRNNRQLIAIQRKVRREVVVKHHIFRPRLINLEILKIAEHRAENDVKFAIRKPDRI